MSVFTVMFIIFSIDSYWDKDIIPFSLRINVDICYVDFIIRQYLYVLNPSIIFGHVLRNDKYLLLNGSNIFF